MSFAAFDNNWSAQGDHSDLEAKLAALQSSHDLEIYDFGSEGYDGLGDALDEGGANELNDDTFGFSGNVGKDFDFSGNHQKLDPRDEIASLKPLKGWSDDSVPTPLGGQTQYTPNTSLAWSLDNDPLLGLGGSKFSNRTSVPPLPPSDQSKPSDFSTGGGYRTLDEIEAEMRATKISVPPPSQSQSQIQPQHRTLEEIEAEMLRPRPLASNFSPLSAPLPPSVPTPTSVMPSIPLHAPTPQQPPALSPSNLPTDPMNLFMGVPTAQYFPPLGTPGPPHQTPGTIRLPPPPPVRPNQPPTALQLTLMLASAKAQNADVNIIQQIENQLDLQTKSEEKAKRRTEKIGAMAHGNGLMTKGDKDFITRIQLSQLYNSLGPNGTHDPYADDFYFHVFNAIKSSRATTQGSNGIGINDVSQSGGAVNKTRAKRDHAQKMAQQVTRLVDDAKKRPRSTQVALEGALGKISLRTKSGPRQALQVGGGPKTKYHLVEPSTLPHPRAAQISATSSKTTLLNLEHIYDIILELEQSRRLQLQLETQSSSNARGGHLQDPDEREATAKALKSTSELYREQVERLWTALRVMDPLEGRGEDLHPFIVILQPDKGKRILPRIVRHLSEQQTLTIITLLVATFATLDVVRQAPILDSLPTSIGTPRADLVTSTEVFANNVLPLIMNTLGQLRLRVITALLDLLIERNDLVTIARTQPGIALLTIFLSRAQLLKQGDQDQPPPEPTELEHWTGTFKTFFDRLSLHITSLFPSSRLAAVLPFGTHLNLDNEDESVWQFLAAVALCSDMNQQHTLVTEAREKILENVATSTQKSLPEEIVKTKLRNTNLLLHALGLDTSLLSES